KVLTPWDLQEVKEPLENIKPMKGVFSNTYIKNLEGTHVKESTNYTELVELLRTDIRESKANAGTENAVMVWCGSTEKFNPLDNVHLSLSAFEQGIKNNDEHISPSQLYAYAALLEQ